MADSAKNTGDCQGRSYPVVIEQEELATVVNALELRKRSSGVGTAEHNRCERVLNKLRESEKRVREDEAHGREGGPGDYSV